MPRRMKSCFGGTKLKKLGLALEICEGQLRVRRFMQSELSADWKLSVRQRSASMSSWNTASISFLSEFLQNI